MDKNAKQIKAAKAKQEEATLDRILCWLAGGAVLETFLLLLDRYYCNTRIGEFWMLQGLKWGVRILAPAALVGAVVCAVIWIRGKKSGKGTDRPGAAALMLLGASVGCFVARWFKSSGLRLVYIGVPVIVALAVIYYLYQKEFFFQGADAALALMGTWVASNWLETKRSAVLLGVVLAVVLILAGALVCRKAQTGLGKLRLGEKTVRVFTKDANYALLYLGAAVNAAVLIAAVLGLATAVLYGVAVAWVLAMAVYYTVKII